MGMVPWFCRLAVQMETFEIQLLSTVVISCLINAACH